MLVPPDNNFKNIRKPNLKGYLLGYPMLEASDNVSVLSMYAIQVSILLNIWQSSSPSRELPYTKL